MPRAFSSGRKFLLLLAAALAFILGAWWWATPPLEPSHDGQAISEWLLRHEGRAFHKEDLHAFGHRLVPWLAYTLEHGLHSSNDPNKPRLFEHAPDWLRQCVSRTWGGLRGALRDNHHDYRSDAAWALFVLGPEAAPAIPALVRTLETATDSTLLTFSAQALQASGPLSWPQVRDCLQRLSPGVRCTLLSTLNIRLDPPTRPVPESEVAGVFAVLAQACGDPNVEVRKQAMINFVVCHDARPEFTAFDSVTSEIIRLLSDTDAEVRKWAAYALSRCGDKAAVAIPRLVASLDDFDVGVRCNAATALSRLDTSGRQSATRLRAMLDDPATQCREAARQALAIFEPFPEK